MIDLIARTVGPETRYKIRSLGVEHLPAPALGFCDLISGLFFPRYFDEHKVIFVHVPKSAGTSIATSLYGRTINHLSAAYYRKANRKKFDSYYSFAVVRNPLERLVSAYLYAKKGGTARVPISNPHLYTVPEFDCFESFFYEWLVNQPQLDFVFRPQYEYVCDRNGAVLVDDIFDLTELQICADTLSERLGRTIQFDRINASAPSDINYGEYYSNPGLRLDVEEFYQPDYRFLGKAKIWNFTG